ncbi:MAG TPA: CBS domain-containing protein [Nitrososphaeraceae archaeon]|nr:CBS domain-containing protein [Nitrososphaeraceae archaeon]
MSIESTPVSSLMTRNVITQTEDQNVHAVSKTMHENNIGSVVIVKNKDRDNDIISSNKPIGIMTERDIVRILGSLEPSLLKAPIRELMSKPLITISPNGSIKDAMQTMQLKNIRRLVVVDVEKEGKENKHDDNKMIGIITDKDIFRAIMKNQDLIPSFLSQQLPIERKTFYEQFSEYWFGDILHKR